MPKPIVAPDQSEPKASPNLPCQIVDVRATCTAHWVLLLYGCDGWQRGRVGCLGL